MSGVKQYAERDHMALGNYYLRHVNAMTAESLFAKSDIAAELAWRDSEIDRLLADHAALLQRVEAAEGLVAKWREREDAAEDRHASQHGYEIDFEDKGRAAAYSVCADELQAAIAAEQAAQKGAADPA